MADEVVNETSDAGSEDLDLYTIQADELAEDGLDVEAEMQKLAREFFPEEEEEEEKKAPEDDEEERRFQARAKEV